MYFQVIIFIIFALPLSQGSELPGSLGVSLADARTETKDTSKVENKEPAVETLSYQGAISKALLNNISIKNLRYGLRSSEISYQNAWDTMFMPSISLSANLTSNFTVGQISEPLGIPVLTTSFPTAPKTEHGYGSSSLTLSLGSYTLFNFWKDTDSFELASTEWIRQKQVFNEQVRTIRNSVTTAFFTYRAILEKLEAARKSIEFSETILELLKSRAKLGTDANVSEIDSSSVDLLNSKNNLNTLDTSAKTQLYQLNEILNDPIGTEYNITEQLNYVPMNITLAEAMKFYFTQSPEILDSKKNIKGAEINLKLTHKNLLPLPRVMFSPINLVMGDTYLSGTSSHSAQSGSGNFDITTSVSVTIPITGPGGLFNRRSLELSEISRDQADLSYVTTVMSGRSAIKSSFNQLKQLEEQIKNNREAAQRSGNVLDAAINQLMTGKVNRLELRDALSQSRDSLNNLEDSYVNHLQNKLSLAQKLGLDHLPGDPY
ncbi:MAG: TolC family protein [Bdellovibrionia bacterium]